MQLNGVRCQEPEYQVMESRWESMVHGTLKDDRPLHYKMDYPERGLCLIIHMERFDIHDMPRRDGSQTDIHNLKKTFKKLGFKVRIEENLSYKELQNVLQNVAAEDHSHRSCFACAIMSHGTEDGIFSRDHIFTLDWLAAFFSKRNCKSLSGKPKLFFIQACRGTDYDFGVETDGTASSSSPLQIAYEEDFLYAYSTPLGSRKATSVPLQIIILGVTAGICVTGSQPSDQMADKGAQEVTESDETCSKDGSSSTAASAEEEEEKNIYKKYPQKGVCLILNNETFTAKLDGRKLGNRRGSDKDAKSLEIVFKSIGFEVRIKKDLKHTEICDWFEAVAAEDHSQRSFFVCVILSHGEEKGFYATDKLFEEEYVFKIFHPHNSPTLIGKPKLFFIQACRGNGCDKGVELHSGSQKKHTRTIPTEADILCHYSTPPGYVAYRHTCEGTWFIQSLCEMLEKYWEKEELLHILTFVNNKVASMETGDGKKEMPCFVSKLTKLLYF